MNTPLYKQIYVLVSANLQHREGSGRGPNICLHNWYILKNIYLILHFSIATRIIHYHQMAARRIQCSCIYDAEDAKYDIIWASYEGHVDCVKKLIAEGCDLEMTEPEGYYTFDATGALRAASSNGHTDVVKILLQAGINVNGNVRWDSDEAWGASPLVAACINNHTETIKILLEANADPNPEPNTVFNEPLLGIVASRNNLEATKLLVEAGASLDITFHKRGLHEWADHVGGSALCKAAYYCHDKIVDYLISAGSDLNIRSLRGKTALMEAAGYCHVYTEGEEKCAQLLIRAGSDIHAKSAHGMSALEFAALNSNRVIMEMLLVDNAHINEYKDEDNNDSETTYECIYCTTDEIYDDDCFDEHLPIIERTLNNIYRKVDVPCTNLAYVAGVDCPQTTLDDLKKDVVKIYDCDDETLNSLLMLKDDTIVPSLTDACRDKIRGHLMELSKAGANFNNLFIAVPRLPLPEMLKNFLLFGMKPQSAWDPLPSIFSLPRSSPKC